MTPSAAIAAAKRAMPCPVRPTQSMVDDPPPGSMVAIRPHEYRTEEVVGELILADQNEWAVRRASDKTGDVVIHFPRLGYTMRCIS